MFNFPGSTGTGMPVFMIQPNQQNTDTGIGNRTSDVYRELYQQAQQSAALAEGMKQAYRKAVSKERKKEERDKEKKKKEEPKKTWWPLNTGATLVLFITTFPLVGSAYVLALFSSIKLTYEVLKKMFQ